MRNTKRAISPKRSVDRVSEGHDSTARCFSVSPRVDFDVHDVPVDGEPSIELLDGNILRKVSNSNSRGWQ